MSYTDNDYINLEYYGGFYNMPNITISETDKSQVDNIFINSSYSGKVLVQEQSSHLFSGDVTFQEVEYETEAIVYAILPVVIQLDQTKYYSVHIGKYGTETVSYNDTMESFTSKKFVLATDTTEGYPITSIGFYSEGYDPGTYEVIIDETVAPTPPVIGEEVFNQTLTFSSTSLSQTEATSTTSLTMSNFDINYMYLLKVTNDSFTYQGNKYVVPNYTNVINITNRHGGGSLSAYISNTTLTVNYLSATQTMPAGDYVTTINKYMEVEDKYRFEIYNGTSASGVFLPKFMTDNNFSVNSPVTVLFRHNRVNVCPEISVALTPLYLNSILLGYRFLNVTTETMTSTDINNVIVSQGDNSILLTGFYHSTSGTTENIGPEYFDSLITM